MELSPSAHVDAFCRDRLPPFEQWPELLFELPELAYPDRLNCAGALLDDTIARLGPDRRCLVTPTEQWSYGELRTRVDRLAELLTQDLGLVPGNRVLLRGPNTPWLVACWLAVLKAGGVVITTMPLLRAGELAEVCEIGRPSLALCDHRFLDELTGARVPGLTVLAYGGDDQADLTVRSGAKEGRFDAVPTAADDVALIAFTSGTTGRPKATLHFHRDVLANADTFSRHVLAPEPDDLFTGTPPLAFTFGLGGLVVFPLRVGAASLLVEQATPAELAHQVSRHQVTVLFTAPTAYRAILSAGLAGHLSGLRRCVSAGESLSESLWREFHAATGHRLIDGIGATEMLHVFISAADKDIRPGATGRPVPGYRAAVVDREGNPVPDGQPGLLAVKGPTGCRYLDDERQTEYVRNGWNITGDTYVRDREGYFWFQARSDDMIVSSGYNIAAPEVEHALAGHPDVADCAVTSAPDLRRGAVVKAYVVLRDGAPAGAETVRALQDHVKQRIAPYKYPRSVEFLSELPRNSSGKVNRGQLRLMALGGPARPAGEANVTGEPARVVVERRVEWHDTDAAGHYHFSSVQRWAEAAEAVLLRRLGLAELFGSIPRVHFEADYRERLWFGDTVRVDFRVARVGGSSLHYTFDVHGPRGLSATGAMSVVHSAATARATERWPDHVRQVLAHSGAQAPETYA
ncbi:AMP-binding protein [Streptacidiphilus rugosus]|uniref:AMP-binding protein n=1 Tax=Streptacidiphilus rugosus TaxID=405783 RepID=UPI000A07B4F6